MANVVPVLVFCIYDTHVYIRFADCTTKLNKDIILFENSAISNIFSSHTNIYTIILDKTH